MTVGIAMLAHTRLDRAAAVAVGLAGQGAAVSVHLDTRVPGVEADRFRAAVGERVRVVSRHAAEWGRFGMIRATWAAVEPLLGEKDIGHVCLLSGACMPLRPLRDLAAFLANAPGQDFIESVPVAGDRWVQDGLSEERFTLYHPFSHRHAPRLFSLSVDVQRRLGVCRRAPPGVVPHLGMQWWCLSTESLRALRDHPDRGRWDRYFARSWIPDESYFQTLVRLVRPDTRPRGPLHVGGFNRRGRPHVFHDDHLDLLRHADGFFARKIDPDAAGLYAHFLDPECEAAPARHCAVSRAFAAARAERETEGRGLITPARLPRGARLSRAETAAPFLVLLAPDTATMERLHLPLRQALQGRRLHGRLFQPKVPADFAVPAATYAGNLSSNPITRDYRAPQFLSRLVWADRSAGSAFWLLPEDDRAIRVHLVADRNARLVFVGGDPGAHMAAFRAPFPGPQGPRLPMAAWSRICNAEESALARLIGADWTDPAGWDVPA